MRRALTSLVGLLLLTVAATGVDAARLRYQGKAYSSRTRGVVQMRVVLFQGVDPGYYSGSIRCRPLTPNVRCLARYTSLVLRFGPNATFAAQMGGGTCQAAGSGTPYGGALSGNYRCGNGDAGSFYFRNLK
jgi:hypothetical protein